MIRRIIIDVEDEPEYEEEYEPEPFIEPYSTIDNADWAIRGVCGLIDKVFGW